jgi:predicted nucleic acid-binding protein
MIEKHFVDTNILIYAFDSGAGEKHSRSVQIVEELWHSGGGCLSMQVLQEFYVNATKKLHLTVQEASIQVRRFRQWHVHVPEPEDLLQAIQIQQASKTSFWDAMVLRSASALGCGILWSEDLNAGQSYRGVRVVNPFKGSRDVSPARRRHPK